MVFTAAESENPPWRFTPPPPSRSASKTYAAPTPDQQLVILAEAAQAFFLIGAPKKANTRWQRRRPISPWKLNVVFIL